ncbi:MAG TPA: outer membrane beta-barrel protein, partial [Methylomirabilota bacterium]|nr:outer membrane beta-barrel protein [Methylomirabilota bacterium]
ADGVRNGVRPVGERLFLYEATATIEYKIWRGLVGRLEYRHDEASRRVFDLQQHGTTLTSRRQDTLSVDLYYLFF